MHHIRPHKLFNQVHTSSFEERMVRLVLPEKRTPTLLESCVLLGLSKIVCPRIYFEIGTFLGIEALNIAANLPSDARVYTLDLDEQSLKTVQQADYDRPLTDIHIQEQNNLAFLGSSYEAKITRLYGDSTEFDFSPFKGRMDMVYVDGGHDLRTLASDTHNAFNILSSDHPACIAWHDFGYPICPDVEPYLLELSKSKQLFHVEETRVVFYLANADNVVANLIG